MDDSHLQRGDTPDRGDAGATPAKGVCPVDFPPWDGLARQDGLPVPAHTWGDPATGFLFARTDTARAAFLTLTGRCGVCGHIVGDAHPYAVIGHDVVDCDQWAEHIAMDETSDGNLLVVHARSQPVIELHIPIGEGVSHRACLAMAATLCPWLRSDDYRFREAYDLLAQVDAMVESGRVSPEELADARRELPAGLLADVEGQDGANRVGRPSGPKWTVSPLALGYNPANAAVGQSPTIAILRTPFAMQRVTQWVEGDGIPTVDAGDPVPAALAAMPANQTSLLFELFAPSDQGRNAACWCGSGLKAKRCHTIDRIPQVLQTDFARVESEMFEFGADEFEASGLDL